MVSYMRFFTETICNGESDALAHLQFEKYGRGTFAQKAVAYCKVSSRKYTINTTSEYARDFIRMLAMEIGSSMTAVEGVIISTKPLPSSINCESISQFMGVKKYSIKGQFTGHQIVSICDSVPRAFVALSFKTPSSELTIKQKTPKSAKPGNDSADKPKVDFCKLKTTNEDIAKNLFFGTHQFKRAEVTHTFVIEEIILPHDEFNPVKMREQAKRKGKIIRKLTVDGKIESRTYQFCA